MQTKNSRLFPVGQPTAIAVAVAMALSLSACGGGGGGGKSVRPDNEPPPPVTGSPAEPSPSDDQASGGSGGGSAPALTAAQFESAEYDAGGFLRQINASTAYANGANKPLSGEGVRVAVIDTGLDVSLPEFAGRVVAGGPVFDGGAGGSPMADPDGHGTHVAGIIGAARNGTGMHGVAWGAEIVPIRMDNVILPESSYGAAFDAARTLGARVMNNSWTMGLDIDSMPTKAEVEALLPTSSAALKRFADAGGVAVFSAGNDGADSPSFWGRLPERLDYLKENWVTVVATGSDGRLAGYSSACGVTESQNWCIAAPGGDGVTPIVSTVPGGATAGGVGTSQAAPVVSGAVAVLMENFPTLNGAQIIDRMFVTANKSGDYADRAQYGNGMLDLGAASSPIGTLTMTSAGNLLASNPQAQVFGGLALPEPAAAALKEQLDRTGATVLAIDSYDNAPFQVAAGSIVAQSSERKDKLGQRVERQSATSAVSLAQGKAMGYQNLNSGERLLVASLDSGQKMAFANDVAFDRLAYSFSPLNLTPMGALDLVESGAYSSTRGFGLGFSQPMGNGWSAAAMAYSGESFGVSETGASAQLSMGLSAHTQLSVGFSHVAAGEGTGIGLVGSGASGDEAASKFRVMMAWQPRADVEVFGAMELGLNRQNSKSGDTFSLARNETRSSLTLGASHAMSFANMTVSGLYKFEPGATERLSLSVPTWVNRDGSVITEKMGFSYKTPNIHTMGMHVAANPGKDGLTTVGMALSYSSLGQAEAIATYQKRF